MTTPTERTRAVLRVSRQIADLQKYNDRTSEIVCIPRKELEMLYRSLWHYPTRYDINMPAIAAPHIWAPVQEKENE